MRLLIIRHGDPDYEKDCLTEKGKKEAALLAEYLKDENINVAIRTFLEKGEIEYDTYNLLYEENKKEYLKVGLYVFIYISLIVILGALAAFIINSINSELVKISLPFVIMIMAFLIVPVIVIYSIDWTLLKGIITKNKDRKG